MNTYRNFNSYIESSIISNWHLDALTDYKGITLQYHDVARKIEKLHSRVLSTARTTLSRD